MNLEIISEITSEFISEFISEIAPPSFPRIHLQKCFHTFMLCFNKDRSWNYMISAHPIGQIFADLVIVSYCFMGEESIWMSVIT